MSMTEVLSNFQRYLERTHQRDFDLCLLDDKGLAHWHVRLQGTGLLARIPKQSQMGLEPLDNLTYEAACFQRAAACGHVPRLDGVIPPSDELPWGALLVEEITGSPANNPDHVAPIMQALASIHRLPVPAARARASILSEIDPLAGLLALVRAQSVYLDHPLVSESSRRTITKRLKDLTASLPQICQSLAPRLITFDAHPGNFLITPTGKAILVDLEKLRYSYPPLDLAHATLYTSTTWDIDASFKLSTAEVARAYEVWMSAVGAMADTCLAALVPLRELMWLWSVTWCAKWLTESVKPKNTSGGGGQDWSQANSDAALIRHVRARVDDYLAISTINQVQAEFTELERVFAHSS